MPRARQWAQSCTAWVFVARSFAGAYLLAGGETCEARGHLFFVGSEVLRPF